MVHGYETMQPLTHDSPVQTILLEPADAGRELGVTPAQVHRLDEQGVLRPWARTVRGTRLYRREDVDRVVAKRRGAHVGA